MAFNLFLNPALANLFIGRKQSGGQHENVLHTFVRSQKYFLFFVVGQICLSDLTASPPNRNSNIGM